jgi:hypothetical protein
LGFPIVHRLPKLVPKSKKKTNADSQSAFRQYRNHKLLNSYRFLSPAILSLKFDYVLRHNSDAGPLSIKSPNLIVKSLKMHKIFHFPHKSNHSNSKQRIRIVLIADKKKATLLLFPYLILGTSPTLVK